MAEQLPPGESPPKASRALGGNRRKERLLTEGAVHMTIKQRRRGSHSAPRVHRPQTGRIEEAIQSEPVVLTVQEVADLLRVSAGTIRAWGRQG